jgi:5'-deoxynucleotidase YfbR-like HD superfamily hydrolase
MSSSILTFTGKWFDVLDPDPDRICLEDIAGALSKLCRFGGHCNLFYSVAEHSLLASDLAMRAFDGNIMLARWGLLHDASEAYVVDLPRPIKRQIAEYVRIEDKIQEAIAKRFRLPWPMPTEVHECDHALLAEELRVYMPQQPDERLPPRPQQSMRAPLERIPLSPIEAQQAFLNAALELGLT